MRPWQIQIPRPSETAAGSASTLPAAPHTLRTQPRSVNNFHKTTPQPGQRDTWTRSTTWAAIAARACMCYLEVKTNKHRAPSWPPGHAPRRNSASAPLAPTTRTQTALRDPLKPYYLDRDKNATCQQKAYPDNRQVVSRSFDRKQHGPPGASFPQAVRCFQKEIGPGSRDTSRRSRTDRSTKPDAIASDPALSTRRGHGDHRHVERRKTTVARNRLSAHVTQQPMPGTITIRPHTTA